MQAPNPFHRYRSRQKHGRDTTWSLRAKETTAHIKANWPGCSWIVVVITPGTRKKKPSQRDHYAITSLRTAPKALLRLARQRWSIEFE